MDLAPTSSEGAGGSGPVLSWLNVTIAILFILLDAFISLILRLDIGTSLIVASGRCVIQLSLMGLVLDQVFASRSIWGVIGIACTSFSLTRHWSDVDWWIVLLNVLGAFETTYNKAKRRFTNMVGNMADRRNGC
jgi:hypothetical protein